MSENQDIMDGMPLDSVCKCAKANYKKLMADAKARVKQKSQIEREKLKDPQHAATYDTKIAQVNSIINSFVDQATRIKNALAVLGCPI